MTTPNTMAALRRENLRRWLEDRKMTRGDMAARMGVGKAYVSLLFSPERYFGEKAARTIESKLHMPEKYLDMSAPTTAAVEAWSRPEDLDEDVYALVPRVEVRLSAGNGLVATPQDGMPPLAFRRDWLSRQHVSGKANLRICRVSGDSMEDYLQDGDAVLIDLGQVAVQDGQVYAIRYGDELRIKRLSRRFDGGLLIRSDNKRYEEESLSPQDAEHIQVLGRCLWRGG